MSLSPLYISLYRLAVC
uniref:Uncharacterized protein n=1 Tax=Arundo donax TaxID=35708 RepID=A0A0A9BPA9_ARUDO